MKSSPRISVITASWNCEETIRDCLASVGKQTWLNREHVVIDGASTDGTLSRLEGYRDQLAVLVSESDNGIYDALNKGIARAGGDVIGFLHADDMFADHDALASVAEIFSDPDVDAVYGDLQYVGKHDTNRVVRHWRSEPFRPRRLGWGWMPPHPTLYVRRDWYEKLAGFDTSYAIAADYHFILRLFSQPDFNSVYVPKVLVRMRLGGASNHSLRSIMRKSSEDLRALRSTNVGAWGGLAALAWKNISKLDQFIRV